MRVLAVNIGETFVEFRNCMWTGYESIFVNGELVSKKFSFFGTNHYFMVEEEEGWAEYVLTTGLGMMGITAKLVRNGIPVIHATGCNNQAQLLPPLSKNGHLKEKSYQDWELV